MKFHTRSNENFIWIENRIDLYGNEMSFRYRVNKYREIHGDGTNPFQNESHSGIVWIASPLLRCRTAISTPASQFLVNFFAVRTCNRGSKHLANNFTSSLLNVEIGQNFTRREFTQYSDVLAAVNICCFTALSTKHCWYNSFRLKDFRNLRQELFFQLKPWKYLEL